MLPKLNQNKNTQVVQIPKFSLCLILLVEEKWNKDITIQYQKTFLNQLEEI